MNENEIVSAIKELLFAFGGVTVVSVALAGWLGSLWQKRILQKEQNTLIQKLESYRHELGLAKTSYDHYLELILDYYNNYYQHYRLCQRACNADVHSQPDGIITNTKDDFDAGLDKFMENWASQEGKIRILLPSELLGLHKRSIDAFNQVKRAVNKFNYDNETRQDKHEAFLQLDTVKTELEYALRKFLRTEELLK
ncbi:hypothetical protein P4S55_18415 [Shewanella sp. PP-Sp27a-2]